jgi:hypothetical protein
LRVFFSKSVNIRAKAQREGICDNYGLKAVVREQLPETPALKPGLRGVR